MALRDMQHSVGERPTDPGREEVRSVGDFATRRAESQRKRYKVGDRILGRYRILGELGQGGMGVVFRCFDETGGIEVALKALPPEVAHDTGEMEEVRESFRLVQGLAHPNIAQIKTLECDPETRDYYLVMEKVEGVNLRQWRKQVSGARCQASGDNRQPRTDNRRDLSDILPILRQAAAALDYAHSRRIVHRDIKPSNVMVGADGAVKVLDFGLAAQIQTSMTRVSRADQGTSGTGPYMAPEQWRGWRQNAATDQYALAVLAYELLASQLPFESGDPLVLKQAVLDEPPRRIEGLDARAWKAMSRGLAKEAEERFGSCGEFVEALGGETVRSGAVRRYRGGRGRRYWVLGIGCLVLAAAAAYWSLSSLQSHRTAAAAREAAARLDAARQAQAAALVAAAERAIEAGDLKTAGEKAAALAGLDAPRAAELRRQIERKAGARDANQRYAEAKVERDQLLARNLAPGQGFAEKLKALEVRWTAAEVARQAQNWGEALSGYDLVLADCREIAKRDLARGDAEARRRDCERARSEAEDSGAAGNANALYEEGGRASARAATAFDSGDFAAAASAWTEAQSKYASAASRARQVQSWRAAKIQRETRLAGVAGGEAFLEQWGGVAWQAVKKDAILGAASADDPTTGKAAYERALAGLDGAVSAAQSASAPTLIVEATAGGAVVAATLSDGTRTWTTPAAIKLAEGQRYNFTVSYTAPNTQYPMPNTGPAREAPYGATTNRRYKPANLTLTADWKGLRTERVALEVYLGHPEGVDWDVDLGGGVTLSLKWIPAGEFNMGSTAAEREWAVGPEGQGKPEFFTNERDPVRVRIARGFWLGKTEVTVGQWRRFIADTPGFQTDAEKMGKAFTFTGTGWSLVDAKSWRDPGWLGVALRDDHPVACISWNDAQSYHAWLKRKIGDDIPVGMTARLPGEAEWEYACRGGREGTKFWWGDRLEDGRGRLNGASDDELGNNSKWNAKLPWSDGYAWASPVDSFGTKGRNGFGLADMLGNVWEWCYDGYDTSGPHGTIWTESTSRRVVRGGSFSDLPGILRCALRVWRVPSLPFADYGFRVCVGSLVVSP